MYKNPNTNQNGFSIVELLIFLFVIVAIGGIGYWRLNNSGASSAITTVNVKPSDAMGTLNKNIFGEHIISVSISNRGDGNLYKSDSYTDYGAGVWDPEQNKPNPNAVSLAKTSGVSVTRWPGGDAIHFFDWKRTVGTNTRQKFGLPEFLKFSKDVGAQQIIEIAEYKPETFNTDAKGEGRLNTPQNAADLVEYLNAPNNGSNPNGGINWAAKRAADGHSDPWGIKYFEYGCETYYQTKYTASIAKGNEYLNFNSMTKEEYTAQYFKIQNAMKAVDPSIKLGAVITANANAYKGWDEELLSVDSKANKKIDFLIFHSYIPQYWRFTDVFHPGTEAYKKAIDAGYVQPTDSKSIFDFSLAAGSELQNEYDLINNNSKKYADREIPIAMTEYNSGFGEADPKAYPNLNPQNIPYRFTLGNALINADMINTLMKEKNNVLLANFHQFANSYFGEFYDSTAGKGKTITRRPISYVHELYTQYFGDKLVNVDVDGPSYVAKSHWLNKSESGESKYKVNYLSVVSSKSDDGNKLYIIVINKDQQNIKTAKINLGAFTASSATIRTLNGAAIDSTNETDANGVKVKTSSKIIDSDSFSYDFEPHSLTAIELTKKVVAPVASKKENVPPNPEISSIDPESAKVGQTATINKRGSQYKGTYKVYWHYPKDDNNYSGHYLMDTVTVSNLSNTIKFKIPKTTCKDNKSDCIDLTTLANNTEIKISLQDSYGQGSNPIKLILKR